MSATITKDNDKPFKRKYLTSHLKARRYLNELINASRKVKHEGGQVDIPFLRGMSYALKLMLDYYSFEADMRIEERLESLESRLTEVQGGQGDDETP